MTYLSKRKFIIYAVTFSICLGLLVAQAFSLSLEQIISRRQSTRSYISENISGQQLLEILELVYGTTNGHRSVPQIGDDYSLVIFPYNETGCYRYVPENNSLVVHNLTVNKNTIPPYDYFNQLYVSTASVILAVVWNQTKTNNGYFASAEAGCFVQNMYLAAASLNLGTCCVGSIHSEELGNDLKLPSTLIPLLVMPLGYPENPYPPASPNYDHMTGNLPPVQYSSLSFEDAIRNILFAQEWAARDLSLQELSQLLWAAYGYTNLTNWGSDRLYHKTTPGIHYELIIYVSNATGIYKYLSEVLPDHTPRHSITEILHGDKRFDIADACAGQVWAADAPAIFLIAFNSSYNDGNTGDTMGQAIPHCFMEVSAGAVIQEFFLEASAWNLSANVVSESPEGWNGTGAQELRSILGLPPSVIPLYIVPVGARSGARYYLTITSNMGGTTSPLPGIYNYAEGSLLYVTAIPNPGYSFGYWLLDGEEKTENPVTVVMDANHTLEAFFVDDIPPEIGVPVQEPPENVTAYQNVTVTVNVTDAGTGVYNVTLWYSIDNGTTWTPLNTTEISPNTYQTTIPGYENCTWITYKIIAYDNNGNPAINDNYGYYYIYRVIPEFPSAIILLLPIILSLIIVAFMKLKKKKQ